MKILLISTLAPQGDVGQVERIGRDTNEENTEIVRERIGMHSINCRSYSLHNRIPIQDQFL